VLLDALRLQGFRVAVGIIALPNPPSVGLHERLGFRNVGVAPGLGFKHGRWHDVGWWQLELQRLDDPPAAPRALPAVVGTAEWNRLLPDDPRRR